MDILLIVVCVGLLVAMLFWFQQARLWRKKALAAVDLAELVAKDAGDHFLAGWEARGLHDAQQEPIVKVLSEA